MRKSEQKFRLLGFINPVDVLIVAGVAALVWAAMILSAPEEAAAKPGDPLARYTVELKRKDAGFYQKARIGETAIDTERGYYIGTIADVYPLPYRVDSSDEDGGVVRFAEVDGLEFVYVVIETNVQISDYATMVGQYDLMVGKEVFIKSKSFAGAGYIVEIEIIE